MSPTEKVKKISISVPEVLLVRAQAQHPGMPTSGIVTLALEMQLRDRDAAGYSLERPSAAVSRFADAKDRLAADARAQFEAGYLAGVEAAGELGYRDIESLHLVHYDVAAWIQPYLNGAMDAGQFSDMKESDAVGPLIDALGSMMSPYGDDMFSPTGPYLRGFAQAMRDLYREVSDGISVEPPTSSGPGDLAASLDGDQAKESAEEGAAGQ
jgi:hypothetical protein